MSTIDWVAGPVPAQQGNPPSTRALLLCYAAAIFAMLPAQIYRLYQTDSLYWFLGDYAGRLMVLGTLIAFAAGRWAMRQRSSADSDSVAAFLWIAVLVALFTSTWFLDLFAGLWPESALGIYPRASGFLWLFDLTIGIGLVALSEELVFRKLARLALGRLFRSEIAILIVSSLIFGLYHWWSGLPNIILAALFGFGAMLSYQKLNRLWPAILVHYVVDVVAFY